MATLASTLVPKRRFTPSGTSIWSADYESGKHETYFTGPNTDDVKPGNSPGQVVTTRAHSGIYSGYYTVRSNTGNGSARCYWVKDFRFDSSGKFNVSNIPATHDFKISGWFYVPSVTLIGWVSFITLHFEGWDAAVTIDSGKNKYAYIWTPNGIFSHSQAGQTAQQWPFDSWFKLEVEIHYRPANQLSTIILREDDIQIARLDAYATTPQAPKRIYDIHFGVYIGSTQPSFAIYNDDLELTDLTGTSIGITGTSSAIIPKNSETVGPTTTLLTPESSFIALSLTSQWYSNTDAPASKSDKWE